MLKDDSNTFQDFRQVGIMGMNNFFDAADIDPKFVPDVSNMVLDSGLFSPRGGSVLWAEKPTGESNDPLQVLVPRTSDGIEYVIAVYANHFWLRDETFDMWIKLYQDFTPTETTIRYGSSSWNAGISNDYFYWGNGKDYNMVWPIFLDLLGLQAGSSDTSITLNDGARFPDNFTSTISGVSSNVITVDEIDYKTGDIVYYETSGSTISGLTDNTAYYAIILSDTTLSLALTKADAIAGTAITLSGSGSGTQTLKRSTRIIIYDGTTYTYKTVYSKSGNVLSLTTTVGTTIGAGASVTTMLQSKPTMEKGKILNTYSRRMMIANEYHQEINQKYSVINDPENFFDNGSDPTDAGILSITDGNGQITSGGDFGTFFLIAKENSFNTLQVQTNSEADGKVEKVDPIIAGRGMGPIDDASAIKVNNNLYYPTRSNGIVRLTPSQTGASVTSQVEILSKNIQPFVRALDFSTSRAAHAGQKVFWTAATGDVNNIVLVYDILKDAWTKFNNWPAADLFSKSDEIYYISRVSGAIFRGLTGRADNNNPFTAYMFTKRFNFAKPANPKSGDTIYVEGFINNITKLYVDVLFNEKGRFNIVRFLIDGGNKSYVSQVDTLALSEFPMAILPMNLNDEVGIGFFRAYLTIPTGIGFYNIQAKFSTSQAAANWAVAGVSINPTLETQIPAQLRLSPLESTS